ncbi:MAG: septum formation protein Maf [Candidatus Cloacimonetes bacterium]|nr:septum formation protein Maf [Candidatus Cloacimonadota bacterium]
MLHNLLKDKEIILASKSPRRKRLFDQLGLKYKQIPSNIAEHHLNIPADEFATYYAREKVKEIAKTNLESFIVGGDTIVLLDDKILGKPKDKREAAKFLQFLSDNEHTVVSAIAIYFREQIYTEVARTRVFFYKLTKKEIEEYIATEEPMDKAGAYGIQGYGSQFIKKIEGCYFNVMGFPVPLFYRMCKKILTKKF